MVSFVIRLDILSKMTFFHIFVISAILFLPRSSTHEAQTLNILNKQSKILLNHRYRREVDDGDVINRFEIERVSPLYDIWRHLPPFEENWIPNPVTSPALIYQPTKELKNESSSFGEFKIEVSKDEEHVVSESGRQFHENSALNWYYSAESYSSVNNPNKSSDLSKLQIVSPKTATTRNLDEDHVVSHVPSFRGGRGIHIDFNLLGSSTTPKVDMATPSKVEEPKPNITTRYILLQSGRIVAINVTSVPSSVLKPNSAGSSNRNPNLPTIYFGSRIKNVNSTKLPEVYASEEKREKESSTIRPAKIELTTRSDTKVTTRSDTKVTTRSDTKVTTRSGTKVTTGSDTKVTTRQSFPVQVKHASSTTAKPQPITRKPLELSVNKIKPTTFSLNSIIIKPNVEYTKSTPKQSSAPNKLQPPSKEDTTLDPAQKWWNEMKAAKKERNDLLYTTLQPKKSTESSRNILDTLINVLKTTTPVNVFSVKTFDSMKKPLEEVVTLSNAELTTNFRIGRNGLKEKDDVYFLATIKPKTPSTKSDTTVSPRKVTKSWASTTLPVTTNKNKNVSPTTTEKDVLDLSVPSSGVKHDFSRIVALPPPPIVLTTEATTPSSINIKDKKNSSRKPRYRGLSHVNLQAPKIQSTESTSKQPVNVEVPKPTASSPRQPRYKALHQSTAEPSKKSTSPQSPEPSISPPPPPRRSRNGFYLRNSVSFQTSSPGSLTDRRTLTSETPIENVKEDNFQPRIDDLLIISFEPTRKSMGWKETTNITEKSSVPVENANKYRIPAKKGNQAAVSPRKQDRQPISTPRPSGNLVNKFQDEVRPKTSIQSKSDGGSRVGRHFRQNNSRSQNIAENVESTSTTSTTKQPYKVYYFEPKRKKTTNLETTVKNETSEKAPENKSARSDRRSSLPNRGQTRSTFNNNKPSSTRQPKQLSLTPKERSTAEEATSTSKPTSKRLRHSPFIWHRPNVGTSRSVPRDILIEISAQVNSRITPSERSLPDDDIYRPVKVQRTG